MVTQQQFPPGPQGPHGPPVYPAPPQPPRKFAGLAWSALILGIVGVVGSPIIFLNNLTAVAAVVGIVLGVIALFGSHRVVAGIGIGVGVFAIIFTVIAQKSAVEELDRGLAEITGDSVDGGPAATDDVTLGQCAVVDEGYGFLRSEADLTITNSTDSPKSYLVTVSLNDKAGARVGEIHAISNSLAAGQSTTLSGLKASGAAPEGAKAGPVACTLADVDRIGS